MQIPSVLKVARALGLDILGCKQLCLTNTIFCVCPDGEKLGKYFPRLWAPCQQGPCLIHVSCPPLPAVQSVARCHVLVVEKHRITDSSKTFLRLRHYSLGNPQSFSCIWQTGEVVSMFSELKGSLDGIQRLPGGKEKPWEAPVMLTNSPPPLFTEQFHFHPFYVLDFK